MDILICVAGWGLIALQTWAMKYHFNMGKTPNGVKLISILVISSALLLTYLSFSLAQPSLALLFGLFLQVCSLAVFLASIRESSQAKLLAAFDENLPHGLLQTGPYALVRHPFYTSYILHWAGWAIAAWSIWGLVPLIAMTTTYWQAARDEERKFSRTDMASAYAEYEAKTGRFFPKLLR